MSPFTVHLRLLLCLFADSSVAEALCVVRILRLRVGAVQSSLGNLPYYESARACAVLVHLMVASISRCWFVLVFALEKSTYSLHFFPPIFGCSWIPPPPPELSQSLQEFRVKSTTMALRLRLGSQFNHRIPIDVPLTTVPD
jgi:hypothetical protein